MNMSRYVVPFLLLLVAIVSVVALAYPWIPSYTTSSYYTQTTATAVNPEFLLNYSTSTITCTGTTPVCFEQVYPYTRTETWSAQTTLTVLVLSSSTNYVAYANTARGKIVVLLGFIIIIGVVTVFMKHRSRSHSQ